MAMKNQRKGPRTIACIRCLACGHYAPYLLWELCEKCTEGMSVREAGLLERRLKEEA